jgi:tRNA(fMet)-specific endonuclease VapC
VEQKVCLDTDVVIAILNAEKRAADIITKINDIEVLITSITLFELMLRKTNLDAIEIFRNKVEILNFDETSARKASIIHKDLKNNGKLIDFRDLFIASIAITNNCQLATFNQKHFENIKDLRITNQ